MYYLLAFVHIIVCIILMVVVLLQSGKAGDLASAFGGASSQTAFGTRGAATLLTKLTAVCAVIFMITSLALAILYTRDYGSSVTEGIYPDAPLSEPAGEDAQPGAQPPAQPEEEGQSEGDSSPPASN